MFQPETALSWTKQTNNIIIFIRFFGHFKNRTFKIRPNLNQKKFQEKPQFFEDKC